MWACGTALLLRSLNECSLTERRQLSHPLKTTGRERYVSACFDVGQGNYMPTLPDDPASSASGGGYLASGTYVPLRELIFTLLRRRRYVSGRHTRANQGLRLVVSTSAFEKGKVGVNSVWHRGRPSLWRGAGAEKST